jgi:hypothetical protein
MIKIVLIKLVFKKLIICSWWHVPRILVLWMLMKEDHEFKVSLGTSRVGTSRLKL